MNKMNRAKLSVGEYIQYLHSKGFRLKEDSICFIFFGMDYVDADENLVKTAIEITLKVQKQFDGSFYLSLLETLKNENIENREQVYNFVKEKHLL